MGGVYVRGKLTYTGFNLCYDWLCNRLGPVKKQTDEKKKKNLSVIYIPTKGL